MNKYFDNEFEPKLERTERENGSIEFKTQTEFGTYITVVTPTGRTYGYFGGSKSISVTEIDC